jgi:hypothetical protein
MEGAQHYRDPAARLRELASAERDVVVRRRLIQMAIRFDQFADELEGKPIPGLTAYS